MHGNNTLEMTDEKGVIHLSSREDGLASDLKAFGLEEPVTLVYMGLLRTGPITVGDMAAKLGVDRARVYRSVVKLKNAGLVATSFSSPAVCSPLEPQAALQAIIDKRRDDLSTMQKLAGRISSALSDIETCSKDNTGTHFSVIQSRAVIYGRIGRILQDSKGGTVYIVTTGADLARMYHTPIPEKVRLAAKNGTVVRLLTESNADSRVLVMAKRFGASDVRTIPLPSRGRMVVQWNGQLIMSNAAGGSADADSPRDAAVHT